MARYQFPPAEILIQPYMAAVGIGPFTFDLSGQLPTGDNITPIVYTGTVTFVQATSQITAVGGLDIFKTGDTITVTGSVSNDGVYTIATGGVAGVIVVNEALINEGPVAGVTISAHWVRSYLGVTDTTANLISGVPTVALNVATVYFQYPGLALHGTHKLTFQYILVSGRQDEADFWGVVVKDI